MIAVALAGPWWWCNGAAQAAGAAMTLGCWCRRWTAHDTQVAPRQRWHNRRSICCMSGRHFLEKKIGIHSSALMTRAQRGNKIHPKIANTANPPSRHATSIPCGLWPGNRCRAPLDIGSGVIRRQHGLTRHRTSRVRHGRRPTSGDARPFSGSQIGRNLGANVRQITDHQRETAPAIA